MSSWAPKLAENVRTARDRCIEQLNGLARQVQGGFDDLRSRAWEFDLDTHPMDRIDAAMTWAEALVRRVVLSRVVELRDGALSATHREAPDVIRGVAGGQKEIHTSPTAGSSAGWNPSRALSTGASVDNTAWTPDVSGVVGENGNVCAQSTETSTPFPDHHKPYSPPEPSTKYRPTFRWTESRSVPTVPKGKATGPRSKPRKYDLRTKIDAKLGLYRHMLENSEAYAQRLAYRFEHYGTLSGMSSIRSQPPSHTSSHEATAGSDGDGHPFGEFEHVTTGSRITSCPGKPDTDYENSSPGFSSAENRDPEQVALPSDRRVAATALSQLHAGRSSPEANEYAEPMPKPESAAHSQNGFPSARESTVLKSNSETTSTVVPERGAAAVSGIQMTKPPPSLSWTLYSNPPPGGDDLRTDLVAMHMAYEGALSALYVSGAHESK